MPCCLAQAVGGNAALALLLTVGTNLAGIFTMPFMLCWLLDTGGSAVALAPGPLLRSLTGLPSRWVHYCTLLKSLTSLMPIMPAAAIPV